MRRIDADALIADCQLAQKQADRHGREFANAFYSGGGEVSTEWWCVEDMIENAPTIDSQQWIPCSERLPDKRKGNEDTEYLVTIDNGEFKYVTSDYWINWFGNWRWNDSETIAWMPLPEPYKERREE